MLGQAGTAIEAPFNGVLLEVLSEFQRKPIATCNFPGGLNPLPPSRYADVAEQEGVRRKWCITQKHVFLRLCSSIGSSFMHFDSYADVVSINAIDLS